MSRQPIIPQNPTVDLAFLGMGKILTATTVVPQELKDEPRWVVWKEEKRNGKKTKVPYNALTGAGASSTDSSDWITFEEAREVFLNSKGRYDGIGFVLGDGFCGFDFDACLHDNEPDPYTASILNVLGSPYCEVSPSGNGLKAIFIGELPPGHKKKFTNGSEHSGIEVYSGSRYFTTTGAHFSGSKEITEVVPERAALAYFLASRVNDTQNQRFKELWLANAAYFLREDRKWAGRSEAQLALVRELYKNGFNTPEKMVGAFRYSGLAYHDWERTIPNYDFPKVASGKEPQPQKEYSESGNSPPKKQKPTLAFHSTPRLESKTEYVLAPLPGADDGWFPVGDISLVGGASGSGKTTFLFDLLFTQKQGFPFWGHLSHGLTFHVLAYDRGTKAFLRTIRRMRFLPTDIPVTSLPLAFGTDAVQGVIDVIKNMNPIPDIIVIEALDQLLDDANKKSIVAPFMRHFQDVAKHFQVAIIGTCGAGKSRPGEEYADRRNRISGSEAWGRNCETVVILDRTEGQREITVLPRNAAPENFTADFQSGRLKLAPPKTEEEREADGASQRNAGRSRSIFDSGTTKASRGRGWPNPDF
jgi:hypothetical protein